MKVELNKIVPLEVLLDCAEGTFFVKATIRNPSGVIVGIKTLQNNGYGNFSEYTFRMPNLPYIVVTYEIFEDETLQVVSDDFCQPRIVESFFLDSGGGSSVSSGNGGACAVEVFTKDAESILVNSEEKTRIGVFLNED